MEESERERLQRFLDELRELIDDVLRHPEWFPPELRAPLDKAWSVVSGRIGEIRSAITESEYQAALDAEGFTGPEFALKMAVWDEALHRARQGPLSTPRPKWWQAVLDWLRPIQGVLKIANTILGSIGEVIPGAGAVDEFKKMLEGALDLGDGGGPIKQAVAWVKRRFRRS
jgi:hypothetical protein